MSDKKDNALSTHRVNRLMHMFDEMNTIQYTIQISNACQTKDIVANISVTIYYKDDNSKLYFDTIHRCHEILSDDGFGNITMTSAIGYAVIHAWTVFKNAKST